jgi:hypothetical protein
VIDLGMTPQQIEQIRPMVQSIVEGRWDFDFPVRPTCGRWVQGLTVRPFLRDYFPGYSRYVWIDADIWFQDSRALELMLARQGEDICLTPELHCAYPYLYGLSDLRANNQRFCTESFGPEAAKVLGDKAVLNAGMFAVNRDSSFWDLYRKFVVQGFLQGPNKWTEQYALNLVMYTSTVRMRPMPAWTNWICTYALPVYDGNARHLCESVAPFSKLSGIHITGVNSPGLQLLEVSRSRVTLPIDYIGFRAATAAVDRSSPPG